VASAGILAALRQCGDRSAGALQPAVLPRAGSYASSRGVTPKRRRGRSPHPSQATAGRLWRSVPHSGVTTKRLTTQVSWRTHLRQRQNGSRSGRRAADRQNGLVNYETVSPGPALATQQKTQRRNLQRLNKRCRPVAQEAQFGLMRGRSSRRSTKVIDGLQGSSRQARGLMASGSLDLANPATIAISRRVSELENRCRTGYRSVLRPKEAITCFCLLGGGK